MLVPQVQPRRKVEEGVKRQKSRSERPGTNRKTSPVVSSTPCGPVKDDRSSTCFRQYPRDFSRSPPPAFHYSCPLPEPAIQAPYPQHAPFSAAPGHFADFQPQSLYLPPLPVTLPSMSSFDPAYVKSESLFCDEDMFGQFNLGYSPLNGMDIPAGQMYQESNVHVSGPRKNTQSIRLFLFVEISDTNSDPIQTPPLSHSHSFEYSRAGSPATVFPGTPVSIPDSPPLVIR